MADSPDKKTKPQLGTPTSEKRRFLSSDYDFIAEYVESQLSDRKKLDDRKNHEILWKEVDRQVRMQPMERTYRNKEDREFEEWRSALELGDLSTACEVLSADVLRLIFPQDRTWMQPHCEIDFDRLSARKEIAEGEGKVLSKKQIRKIQKQADSELKAFMTQQHTDFGLRGRVELSIKEALKHGSFVAEAQWQESEKYKMGGVFESAAAPVWTPHSMWNCYPETLELGVDMMYSGSMIITWEKSYEWMLRQSSFINLATFQKNTENKKDKVELKTYYGDITVQRKTKDMFLPNMKIVVANETVIFAQPMNNISIIYAGYDRVDIRDPYYLSPLVKNSPNHKLATIIANRFVDTVELKLDPPGAYNGNDAQLVAQGGPKMIPGYMSATKGGDQSFNLFDVGDPSWAITALEFLQSQTDKGTGVSGSRAGAQRQADRVTATQIEEESAGSQIRTIDFTGKVEMGIKSYLYISHELNKDKLTKYKYYNPEMGMKDFDTMKKSDLPKYVIFDIVGSKSILMERRRAEGTFQVTSFLLSNPVTAPLVNGQEVALQMYTDAGNKTPERLLNIGDENDQMQRAIAEIQQKAQEVIQQMQEEIKKVAQDLLKAEQKSESLKEQDKIKTQRSNATEQHLREELASLKNQMQVSAKFLQDLGKIKDETEQNRRIKEETERLKEASTAEVPRETEEKESKPTVVVNIEKGSGYKVKRDENGDLEEITPSEAAE